MLKFVLALCSTIAMLSGQPHPSFEVASIKPSETPTPEQVRSGQVLMGARISSARAEFGNTSLQELIVRAHGLRPFQVKGPTWIDAAKFDIAAKLPPGASTAEVPAMLQALLADRFKLAFHRETKEYPVYVLIVSKNGPKLTPRPKNNEQPARNGSAPISLDSLAQLLSRWMDRPVIDQTAMEGEYMIPFEPIAREEMLALKERAGSVASNAPASASAETGGTGIFGVMESLGLKLEAQRMTLPVLVIDRLEKQPTEN